MFYVLSFENKVMMILNLLQVQYVLKLIFVRQLTAARDNVTDFAKGTGEKHQQKYDKVLAAQHFLCLVTQDMTTYHKTQGYPNHSIASQVHMDAIDHISYEQYASMY